jgi:hypothetical protein
MEKMLLNYNYIKNLIILNNLAGKQIIIDTNSAFASKLLFFTFVEVDFVESCSSSYALLNCCRGKFISMHTDSL